jgi:hypothetical protein
MELRMAFIDTEYRNARLIWSTIMDKVLIVGLIAISMGVASFVAEVLFHVPTGM